MFEQIVWPLHSSLFLKASSDIGRMKFRVDYKERGKRLVRPIRQRYLLCEIFPLDSSKKVFYDFCNFFNGAGILKFHPFFSGILEL
jgi:hypothetical protein